MQLKERRSLRLSCEAPVLIKFPCDPEQRVWAYLAGMTADVSIEGASVVLAERIAPGSTIELEFLLTGDARALEQEIRKTATVVWAAQHAPLPSAPFRHGLLFSEPDPNLLFRAWPGERVSG